MSEEKKVLTTDDDSTPTTMTTTDPAPAKAYKILGRDEILGCDDRVIERVDTPEWGGSVYVRSISSADKDRLEMETVNAQQIVRDARAGKGENQVSTEADVDFTNYSARMVSLSIVDSDDPATAKRVFDITDAVALGEKSSVAMKRVYAVAVRLSGMREADVEEAAGN